MTLVPYNEVVSSPIGVKVAGAQLQIFQTGTDDLVPLYQDADGMVALVQPLLSDSEGRFTADSAGHGFTSFYLAAGTYDEELRDAQGNLDAVNPRVPFVAAGPPIAGAMTFRGGWNASTNSPTLVNGTGEAGDLYRVTTAGSHDFGAGSITFAVSDEVYYDGSAWQRSEGARIESVNGRVGIVTGLAEETDLIRFGDVINAKTAYGAKGDMRSVTDAAMSATSNPTHLTTATYTFTAADVGKVVKVVGAAAAGANLYSTIISTSFGAAVLADAAATTVSGAVAIFATDDTDALQAAFDQATATMFPRQVSRLVALGGGAFAFSQLVLPRRGVVVGEDWGAPGDIFGFGNDFAANTMLYQLWGQDDDALRFNENFGGSGTWQGGLKGFLLEQDPDNAAGNGIAFRKSDDTPLWVIDGAQVEDIMIAGFAGVGMEVPAGAMPATFRRIDAFANLGVGVEYTCHPGGDAVHFDGLSGDQNGDALLRLIGQGASLTAASVTITNMKSEMGKNVYRPGDGTDRQQHAIIFESMQWARVAVRGLNHHADAGTDDPIGAAMLVPTGSVPPEVSWEGVQVTVRAPQTAATAYALTDEDASRNVVVSTTGRGSWGNGGVVVEGERGAVPLRKAFGIGDQYYGQTAFGEHPGEQFAGSQPVRHSVNLSAVSGKQHLAWVHLSDGTLRLRGLKADATVDADEAYIVHRDGPGIRLEIPKLNLGIMAASAAPVDSLFVDSADSHAKYKDPNGVLYDLNLSAWPKLDTGEENIPRTQSQSTYTLTSGQVRFAFFTARYTQTITQLALACATAKSGTGPTLIRLGLYLEDPVTGAISLVASTANDTSLFASNSTRVTKAITSPASYGVVAGSRYAIAGIVVTAGTAPTASAASIPAADSAAPPRLASLMTGQSDLPSSVTKATLDANLSGLMPYGVLLP